TLELHDVYYDVVKRRAAFGRADCATQSSRRDRLREAARGQEQEHDGERDGRRSSTLSHKVSPRINEPRMMNECLQESPPCGRSNTRAVQGSACACAASP